MSYPRLPFVILPWTRREGPGWGLLFKLFGVSVPIGSTRWKDAPTRVVRGKTHGYLMELNLSDWSERMTYFLGRYFELPQEIIIGRLVLPGDRVVDVGGNIGMITLMAARAVGKSGVVQTFEPNPDCRSRIAATLQSNRIDWVDLIPFGLSDQAAQLELSITNGTACVGTFAKIEPQYETTVSKRMTLQVIPGDDVLLKDPRPVKLMKMDVEGFETRAITGLGKTIERDHPVMVVETVDVQLRRAGSSAQELVDLMRSKGYTGYAVGLRKTWLKHTLSLRPLKAAVETQSEVDTLWLHPSGPSIQRSLESYVVK